MGLAKKYTEWGKHDTALKSLLKKGARSELQSQDSSTTRTLFTPKIEDKAAAANRKFRGCMESEQEIDKLCVSQPSPMMNVSVSAPAFATADSSRPRLPLREGGLVTSDPEDSSSSSSVDNRATAPEKNGAQAPDESSFEDSMFRVRNKEYRKGGFQKPLDAQRAS